MTPKCAIVKPLVSLSQSYFMAMEVENCNQGVKPLPAVIS